MLTLKEVYEMLYIAYRNNYIAQFRDDPNNLSRVNRLANIGAVKNTTKVWKGQWI